MPELTPEEIEALNADPPEEAIIEDIEEAVDDIDELSEQLAVHSIISEERHDEILARVDECNQTIQILSSQANQAENPILTQLLNQMIELRTELASLKFLMDSRLNRDRTPNASETPTPIESPAEPNQERSTEEPFVENVEAKPRPKNRFI
jgi:hypothetical protein